MSGWSDAEEVKLLNYYFRGSALTPPATLWVALCESAPSDSSNTIDEPDTGAGNYPAYTRQSITTSGWDAASGGNPSQLANSVQITFGQVEGDMGTKVTHFALMSLQTGGTLMFSGTIVVPSGGLTLNASVQPQFDAGALILQLN